MNTDLKNIQWGEFEIGDLFYLIGGKGLIKSNREKGDIPYYSASTLNNGLTDFVNNPLFIEKDALIVITFGNSYFVKGQFTASESVTVLKNDLVNENSGKFIATVINSNKDKFSFGYGACIARIKRQKILLPTTQEGKPDYEYMERYIKRIKIIKYNKMQNFLHNKLY